MKEVSVLSLYFRYLFSFKYIKLTEMVKTEILICGLRLLLQLGW